MDWIYWIVVLFILNGLIAWAVLWTLRRRRRQIQDGIYAEISRSGVRPRPLGRPSMDQGQRCVIPGTDADSGIRPGLEDDSFTAMTAPYSMGYSTPPGFIPEPFVDMPDPPAQDEKPELGDTWFDEAERHPGYGGFAGGESGGGGASGSWGGDDSSSSSDSGGSDSGSGDGGGGGGDD